jgi:hypothetical protein
MLLNVPVRAKLAPSDAPLPRKASDIVACVAVVCRQDARRDVERPVNFNLKERF